jgi:hypothetical protein
MHDSASLSGSWKNNAHALEDRARAHGLIFAHARKAGIGYSCEEMQFFSRELFLLSRQCGSAGLVEYSKRLFELARAASGPHRANRWDYRLYKFMTDLFGWTITGRVVRYSDKYRK